MTTPAHPAHPAHRRKAAQAAAIAAVTAIIFVGPLALPSSAADYTANSEATWRAALVAAIANTGETNTITLTGDFAMSDPTGTWPEYTGVDQDLIIDGDGHTISAAPGNTAGFLFAYNVTGSVTLRNVTIDGFTSDYSASIDVGGTATLDNVTVLNFDGVGSAVYLQGDNVEVMDSTFTDNTGDGDGGAVYAECDSSLYVDNSSFTGNSSQGSGGALWATCDMDVYDSAFTNNTAVVDGGAIYANSYADIYDSTFTGNSADGYGGAVEGDQETYTSDSAFTNNHADEDGGAVWSQYAGYPEGSTFTGNSAGGDGGAFYVYEGPFEAYESTFTNNTAGDEGGGAYGYFWADSYESTWVGNEAAYGGAMYAENDSGGYTWIEQSTYIDNYASVYGGAYYATFGWAETYNSVFSGNEAGLDGAHLYFADDWIYAYATVFEDAIGADGCWAGGADSWGYNFDDDGTCTDDWAGTDDFGGEGEDPMLGALADNGGPTLTRQPLPGSPLIDAIPWGTCSETEYSYDQRGVYREDTGADVDGCDIGSVEVIKDLSFPIVGSSGTTTVTVAGALGYDCDAWTPIAGYTPTPPAGVSFPHGVFSYCLYVPWDGSTVTVTLNLPSPVNALWKETAGVWSQVPGAVFAGTTITYDVTDGGALDADGDADSYIVDPVGPGLRAGFTG